MVVKFFRGVIVIVLEQIRKKLQEAIKLSGLTQTEIARRLKISQQSVSNYLNLNKMPALDTFANLCVILDLDANEILCIR